MLVDIVLARVRKRVEERLTAVSQKVLSGAVESAEGYRYATGKIKGYRDALEDVAEVVRHYREESEEDDDDGIG
jgi:hypothetical protein